MRKSIKYIIVTFTLGLIFIGSSLFAKAEFIEGNTSVRNAFEVPFYPFQFILNIENSSDVRWFKITLNETTGFKLKSDEEYHLGFEIYNEDSLKSSDPQVMFKNLLDMDYDYYKLEAGTYYIKVFPDLNNYPDWEGKDIEIIFDTFDDDGYEPNDTYKQATQIILGEPMNIRISGYNDEDWLKITLNETTGFKLKSDEFYHLDFQIYNEDSLNSSNPQAIFKNDLNIDYDYYKLEAGTYYIKVFPDLMNTPDWKGKDIKITFKTVDEDSYEPNDTYKQATQIVLEQPMNIRIGGYNDEDWFKITLNETTGFKFKSDELYHLDFQIYNEDSLSSSDPEVMFENDLNIDYDYYKLEAGTYYIKVFPDLMNTPDWKGKDIKITFKTFDEDSYEPNDTYKQATQIILGQPLNIRMSGYNDEDWFKIILSEATALKLKLDGDYHLGFQIYNEDSLNSSDPEVMFENQLHIHYDYYKLEAGTYYIKVFPDFINSPDWKGKDINVMINATIDDQFEYNDTWETAKSFPLSQEKEININAPTDEDWFKFVLSESKDLRLFLSSNYYKTFNYDIYKENDPSNSINSGSINSESGNIGMSLEPGTYRLRLWGNKSNCSEEMMKFMIAVDGEDLVRPTISQVSPGSPTEINENIEIIFSKPMDLSTLTQPNISLKWFNDNVDFEIDYIEGENKLILIPSQPLNYSSEYTVKISKNVKARENQLTMINDYTYTFKTRDKRPSNTEGGTLSGKVLLNDYLQRLAMAGEISLYQGSKYITTVYPDRSGKFSFIDVASGQYTVKVNIPGFLSDSKTVTINYGDDLTVTLEPTLGDLNGDGIIDLYDITIVSGQYNQQSQ